MEQYDEMPEVSDNLHPNVIIHVDFDYYYAQVEEVLDPGLKDKPLGIKQRFHIVTCNYKAREYGVKKMDLISDSLRKCPALVIINGEDLSKYKTYSKRIAELLHSLFGQSEKLGLDEHFLDVTKQVEEQISKMTTDELQGLRTSGPFYPSEEAFAECGCGCDKRLMLGSQIARNIREKILHELKLTCSVGVAHNKLLAKLVGQVNKPDNQTVLAPTAAVEFMADLKDLRSITGIGGRTASRIEELGIKSVAELQNCDVTRLQKKFGADMAARLKDMSIGFDPSEVKPSGKPKTVGLEDSCRPISIRSDAQEKFRALLTRLVTQIQDDGRIPQSIKVTVRKYDPMKKNSIRETKQCALVPSHFRCIDGKIQLVEDADEKILKNVMILFDRMVDLKQQFNITLLGLCFSKFQEDQKRGPGSIASFLMKKQDVEVQSITNLSNESINGSLSDSFRSKTASPSSSVMDYETMSNTSFDFSGSEESEFEPSPKKRKKLNLLLVAKSRRYSSNDDIASPSKLNVSALHLNGSAMDTSDGPSLKSVPAVGRVISPLCISNDMPIPCTSKSAELPPNVDPTVWRELPIEVQRELITSWHPSSSSMSSSKPTTIAPVHPKQSKTSGSLHKYFIRNS